MVVPPELARASDKAKPRIQRDAVVIRFAGDSGDGMQVAGMQFNNESAIAGNALATLPDFPAEIRNTCWGFWLSSEFRKS